MPLAFRLIVGLGNPTPKYEHTRHNAGFWFVDEIARRYKLNFASDSRSQGMLARLDWEGESVYLLKPMQYMNRSGGSVLALANSYKIDPARILVAHDELGFPPGVVRLKVGGGHGGHNGLRDIVARLGNSAFARIRFGVGHPGNRDQVVSYVLDSPSKHDAGLIGDAVVRAAECLPEILNGKLDSTMNSLHVETAR
ncbi:Peptidyl-tRNA hydrolase [Methylococcales bacterium]|nr:Peptidyl-tRNA hydrolase [Methylococcales bacterium]